MKLPYTIIILFATASILNAGKSGKRSYQATANRETRRAQDKGRNFGTNVDNRTHQRTYLPSNKVGEYTSSQETTSYNKNYSGSRVTLGDFFNF